MGDYVDTLKSIFVEAAKLAKVIPNNLFKLKKYKCPDLTQARDTKIVWWRLWSDNGKPREGEVYKCYKKVKKLFCKLSRQCVTEKKERIVWISGQLIEKGRKSFLENSEKNKEKWITY